MRLLWRQPCIPEAAARRQEATNMTRINEIRTIAKTWGNNASTLFFAAVLIVCSVTVGCSSDKPKPVTSTYQNPVTQPEVQMPTMPAPAVQATAKPAPKKVVRRKPATVSYTDKNSG